MKHVQKRQVDSCRQVLHGLRNIAVEPTQRQFLQISQARELVPVGHAVRVVQRQTLERRHARDLVHVDLVKRVPDLELGEVGVHGDANGRVLQRIVVVVEHETVQPRARGQNVEERLVDGRVDQQPQLRQHAHVALREHEAAVQRRQLAHLIDVLQHAAIHRV